MMSLQIPVLSSSEITDDQQFPQSEVILRIEGSLTTPHHFVVSKSSPRSKYVCHVRPYLWGRHILVGNSKSNLLKFASLFSSPYCCRQWLSLP